MPFGRIDVIVTNPSIINEDVFEMWINGMTGKYFFVIET